MAVPTSNAHFGYCLGVEGRLPIPVVFFFLGNLNHLLLTLNSSVNGFIYYYCGLRWVGQHKSKLIV